MAILRVDELLAPLPGCCEGGHKTGGYRLGCLRHPIRMRSFASFVFAGCFCADGYALHVTNLRSHRSATARLPFLDQMRTRPPSSSGRGPTLQKTAFSRSCLFFTHTAHQKSEEPERFRPPPQLFAAVLTLALCALYDITRCRPPLSTAGRVCFPCGCRISLRCAVIR